MKWKLQFSVKDWVRVKPRCRARVWRFCSLDRQRSNLFSRVAKRQSWKNAFSVEKRRISLPTTMPRFHVRVGRRSVGVDHSCLLTLRKPEGRNLQAWTVPWSRGSESRRTWCPGSPSCREWPRLACRPRLQLGPRWVRPRRPGTTRVRPCPRRGLRRWGRCRAQVFPPWCPDAIRSWCGGTLRTFPCGSRSWLRCWLVGCSWPLRSEPVNNLMKIFID